MLSQKKDKEKLLNEVICRWILLYYLLKYKFQDKVSVIYGFFTFYSLRMGKKEMVFCLWFQTGHKK